MPKSKRHVMGLKPLKRSPVKTGSGLSDVNMPVMDGIECCRKIKSDPRLKDIPVVVVYAASKGLDDKRIRESGCDGVLHKPVDRNEFLAVGRNFLPEVDRRYRRVPCQMTVDFSIDGKPFQGQGYNISLSGIYIQYRELIPNKARLELSFLLPNISPDPIECWSVVTWGISVFRAENSICRRGSGLSLNYSIPTR